MDSGSFSPTVHCNSCSNPITLAFTPYPAKFCPNCGSSDLTSDKEYARLAMARSLSNSINGKRIDITPEIYDTLLNCFRTQSAFIDFRDYVNCMVFGAKP